MMSEQALANGRVVRLTAPAASAASCRLEYPQGFLTRLFDALGAWQDRAAERRQLARLDDRMLRDIGIDSASARYEALKRFWQD
jgi:uncharacterized protein YjiS (DUF1127 family)